MTQHRGPRVAAIVGIALLLAGLGLGAAADTGGKAGEWNFEVLLNDQPIGSHRFSVTGPATARKVASVADFSVKLLGLTVYRYHHEATEQWKGDCLESLSSNTDDNGSPARVQAQARGDALEVTTPDGSRTLPGCVMGFAYWNPAIQAQTQLLNVQNGKLESVQFRKLPDGSIRVRGEDREARQWRIEGPPQPITLWYSPQGDWLGLDATVAGGRTLRYRLR